MRTTFSFLVSMTATTPRWVSTTYSHRPPGDSASASWMGFPSHRALGSPTHWAHPSSRLSVWTNATGLPAFACMGSYSRAYSAGWLVYRVYSRDPLGDGSCISRVPDIRSDGDFRRLNTGYTSPSSRSSRVTR